MADYFTLLWQLFSTFFIIGMFTFGGGYAIISLIQTEVVTAHGWLTEGTFTDIVGISQMTPGPIGVNCATYTGYEVFVNQGYGQALGVVGSAVATFSLVLPSFIIMMSIVLFYMKFSTNKVFRSTMDSLKPAVVGMLAAAALILIVNVSFGDGGTGIRLVEENFPHWSSWLLLAAGFVAAYFFKASPLLILLGAGVVGLFIY